MPPIIFPPPTPRQRTPAPESAIIAGMAPRRRKAAAAPSPAPARPDPHFQAAFNGHSVVAVDVTGLAPVAVAEQLKAARPVPLKETSSDLIGYNWINVYASYLSDLRREGFLPALGSMQDRKQGGFWPFYRTETELGLLRAGSRIIAGVNQHGGGLLGGLSAYIIDTGMVPKCTPKDGTKDPQDAKLCDMTQAVLDEFFEREEFDEFQISSFIESQADGDFYARIFNQGGYAELRSTVPELVRQPVGSDPNIWSYGHRTPPGDTQKTLSYWVSEFDNPSYGEEVPDIRVQSDAHDAMIHIPAFLPGRWPRGIKRGIPLFAYGTRDAIDSAEKLLRNMGLGSATRQAFAYVREWSAEVPKEKVEGLVEERASYRTQRPFRTDQTRNTEWLEPGQVEDMPENVKFAQPPANAETQYAILVLDALYRAAGQLWQAPEWLMSGNASNMAAYTASLVAKSPFVKRCRQGQARYRRRFLLILQAVVRFAVWAGRLPEAVLHRVKVDLTAPSIEEEKKLEKTQIDQIKVGMGTKSRQKVAEEDGDDWQRTLEDNKEFLRETAGAGMPNLGDTGEGGEPQPGQPQQLPMPGASTGEPEEGDLDPFGDIQESMRRAMQPLLEQVARLTAALSVPLIEGVEPGFSGTVTDSKGREYHYQDGKRIAKVPDAKTGQEKAVPIATFERTPEVARQAHQNFAAALAMGERGEWQPQDVLDHIPVAKDQALAANQKNHAARYSTLKKQFERLGPEAMESPEWAAVKQAFREARDEGAQHIERMAHVTEAVAEHHQRHGTPVEFKGTDESRELAQSSADMATSGSRHFDKIAAAVIAFRKAHEGKARPATESLAEVRQTFESLAAALKGLTERPATVIHNHPAQQAAKTIELLHDPKGGRVTGFKVTPAQEPPTAEPPTGEPPA